MLFLGFLILGIILTSLFFPFWKKTPFFWPVAYFLGVFGSGTLIFGLTFLFLARTDPLKDAILVFGGIVFLFLILGLRRIKISFFFSKSYLVLFLLFFLFSWWFFSRTFTAQNGNLLVASNEYLDFGAHVPLIRSFSWGRNFPPAMPFYSGQPMFYYFLFDFTAATLEKTGWSIATADNLLSAGSLAFLFIFIFYFSQTLFRLKSRLLGLLAVGLFFLSPDLSFLYFFEKHGLSDLLVNLKNHQFYLNNPTTDPFLGGFFTINVLTNQRHLLFGFGLFAILVLVLFRLSRRPLPFPTIFFTGLFLGLLPFWHNFVFLAGLLVLATSFLFWRKTDIVKILLIALLLALPQILFIQSQTTNQIAWRPGFLAHDGLTVYTWIKFWFFNLGLGLPLAILGWWLAPTTVKKFLAPFLVLFLVPNLFTFAREPFNDHKFFNLLFIFSGWLIAWFLVCGWRKSKILVLCCLWPLTASGILNLLVVKNDVWVAFPDVPSDAYLTWVEENTSPRDVFLTNQEIWDPTNFTGRPTFLGRPHYLWAYGANPAERMEQKALVLQGQDKTGIEAILRNNNIKFLAFRQNGASFNRQFFAQNFSPLFQDSNWVVYPAAMLK